MTETPETHAGSPPKTGETPAYPSEAIRGVFATALAGTKTGRRHQCEVASDRLGDIAEKYAHLIEGDEADAIGLVRFVLEQIADGTRS